MRHFFTISKYNNQYLSTYFKVNNNNIIETKNTLSSDVDQTICYNGTDYSAIVDDTLVETINTPQDKTFKSINLDKYNTISITSYDHQKIQKDYKKLENCAVFSPYHILLDQIKLENKKNTLSLLIYNNKIYSIIIDKDFEIIFHCINRLTSAQEIEASGFYTDESQKQQLLQEIQQIELQKNIEDILEKFYSQKKTFFIENIDIFDPQMLLKTEHINEIAKNTTFDIEHINININEILLRLTQKELNYHNLSYLSIKISQKQNNNIYFILPIIAIFALALGYYFFTTQESKIAVKKPKIKVLKITQKVILPNHMEINKRVTGTLNSILQTITYDSFIEKLTLEEDNATIELQLLHNDSFIKHIKPNLLKIYNDVKVIDKKDLEYIFRSKIQASNLIKNIHEVAITKKEYLQDKFYTKDEIQTLIENSFQNIKIKPLASTDPSYNFKVIKTIDTPKDVYRIVSKLDSFNKAINITYPISITKNDDKLEVEFTLQYHQKKTDLK